MEIPVNSFKHGLQAGRLQIGLWSTLCSTIALEIVAGAGFDWIVIDTEHAPNELPMVLSQLQAAKGGTAHPVVRVPWNDMVTIKRYLDIGAQTLLVPYVDTAEQARDAVAYMRYPPGGVRGYAAAPRATLFGRVRDYPQHCEEQLCLLVQVESRRGMQNIETIAAVDGVDGLFIGPGDLAAALGHVGNPKHPEVVAAVEDAIERIRSCGKPAGILTSDVELARRYIERGCLFTAVGSDQVILARGSEQLATTFRSPAGSGPST